MQKILVTGSAGFIGYHLSSLLCQQNYQVVGIDSLNNYYDVNLKLNRINELRHQPLFSFRTINICDKTELDALFAAEKFDVVINLAAQAGVRNSIEKPYAYIDSNLIGFINILEACRNFPVKHLIFASSSSIYGNSDQIPFSEEHKTDAPVSLYAATKKANELMAHSYAHLYQIPTTGLRFFTVYGPWGRPDMAYFSFTKSIMEGKPINIYNNGNQMRDFTYIDDIVNAISALISKSPEASVPFNVFNIGNHRPVKLLDFITTLVSIIGVEVRKNYLPRQSGDVDATYADISRLNAMVGFSPKTDIREGLTKFVVWYRNYYSCESTPSTVLINN